MGRLELAMIESCVLRIILGSNMCQNAEHDCDALFVFGDLGAVKRSCCLKKWLNMLNAGCETMVVKQKNAEGYLLRLALYKSGYESNVIYLAQSCNVIARTKVKSTRNSHMLGVKKEKNYVKSLVFGPSAQAGAKTDHQAGRSPGINGDLWAFPMMLNGDLMMFNDV